MLNIPPSSIQKLSLPAKEKAALWHFKKELLKRLGGEVKEIRLFGSKARGDWHKYSDTDILVVLRAAQKDERDIILDIETEILLKYGVNISAHIYSGRRVKHLRGIPTVFFQLIAQESKKI